MISSGLNSIYNLFQADLARQSVTDVFNEAVLMTLSRATIADTNIKHIELETVQRTVKDITGADVSLADVRIAAKSKLFESAPLDRHLTLVGKVLDVEQKLLLLNAVVRVIQSDERVSSREIRFFNIVAESIGITAAELMGLRITE